VDRKWRSGLSCGQEMRDICRKRGRSGSVMRSVSGLCILNRTDKLTAGCQTGVIDHISSSRISLQLYTHTSTLSIYVHIYLCQEFLHLFLFRYCFLCTVVHLSTLTVQYLLFVNKISVTYNSTEIWSDISVIHLVHYPFSYLLNVHVKLCALKANDNSFDLYIYGTFI
jgi:hypothetical protein